MKKFFKKYRAQLLAGAVSMLLMVLLVFLVMLPKDSGSKLPQSNSLPAQPSQQEDPPESSASSQPAGSESPSVPEEEVEEIVFPDELEPPSTEPENENKKVMNFDSGESPFEGEPATERTEQIKKLIEGGMNNAQAELFLTRKEQLAKDSSGIISCSWREQRNDYLIVTDAKRKYKIKNGNNWLEQTQTYTIGFKGNQINNMTDYNGVSIYENMERKKGYVPLTPEMIEAGTEYMAQQVCEKNKNWFSAADPYSFHYSGRITIEFATDELHQGYNSNDEIQFVDVLLKDGKLYLSGSVYVSFPDDPKFHEEVSAYNDRGIRTLILAVFQQNTILKNGAFNPNSLIELRVYEYVEGLF